MKILQFLTIATLSIMAISCGGGKKSAVISENDSLRMEVMTKDALIEEIFTSLEDITSNLNLIKERENIVAASTGNEIRMEPVARISADLNAIDELMQRNRETIDRLEKSAAQLRNANVKIGSLEKLIAELRTQADSKDSEITDLKNELRSRNIAIEDLQGKVSEMDTKIDILSGENQGLSSTVSTQKEQLTTAYYIVGPRKELMANGIVLKAGSKLRYNEKQGTDKLTRINNDTFEQVLIGKKKVEIVTPHPETSYEFVMDGNGNYVSLVIIDKEKFWELSKVLVISYR